MSKSQGVGAWGAPAPPSAVSTMGLRAQEGGKASGPKAPGPSFLSADCPQCLSDRRLVEGVPNCCVTASPLGLSGSLEPEPRVIVSPRICSRRHSGSKWGHWRYQHVSEAVVAPSGSWLKVQSLAKG